MWPRAPEGQPSEGNCYDDPVTNSPLDPDPRDVLRTIGWEPSSPPARITGGWDTLLWRFERDGKPYALRLYRNDGPPAGLLAGADAEEAAMVAVRAGGLPAPRVEARGVFEDAPFFVLEWRPGERMLDLGQKRPWRIGQLARNFGRMQARLHAFPPPTTLRLYDESWLSRNVAHERLVRAVTADARYDAICHLDYHPLNVLVRGTRMSGLLDFKGAAVSDRRADLAFTKTALLAVPLPHDWKRPLLQRLRTFVAREWEAGYRQEAGHFPLTPAWEALGIWHYTREVESAVADGRGWAKREDLAALHVYRDARLNAAGLAARG